MGKLPLNWSQWSSDGQSTLFAVTATPTNPALSGTQSISVTSGSGGMSHAVTRAWLDETMPADVQVSSAVYISSLIPAQVIARGSYLNMPDDSSGDKPSFYALQLSRGSPGPKLELIKDVNGTETSLGSINAPDYVQDVWLRETLDVEGNTERAQLFDPVTGEYLNSSGQWQTTQAWAITVIDNSISGPGFVGLGRPASYTGTATFDDFSVQTPAADQSFDGTSAGSLPDNWSQWSSNGSNNFFTVASPTNPQPVSGPNAMTVTPVQSSQTARAWLNTSLPADLTASADVYLNALTPAQVFARGSDLDSATPTYYAVEVYRGMTVELVKVVNGVATDLDSVTSTNYLQNTWVQETLGLSGSTLEAQIYRPDTQQYLNSSGDWQSAPTWAVSAIDTSISGGGQAGLARPVVKEYVETNYFDNFTTAVGVDAQNFDATSANPLPSGMTQWSSDGNNNYFSMAAAPDNNHFLSAGNVLESARTPSGVTAQAWDTNEELTNAQVSAGVYVSAVMPTVQVIARGTNLGQSTVDPSYYGLSVTESDDELTIKLVRVNGGAASPPLGQITSPYYFNQWIQETLYVDGNNLRASIYRADTGQYLNSNGEWQTLPSYALNAIDTSSQALTGAGYGGLALPANSSYTGYLDNFAVTPLSVDSTPPTVTVSVPSGTLTGDVTVTATTTETVPGYNISKVAFYVDGVLNWVDTASPYTWDFDTKSVSNGTHTLLVKAYDNEGNIGTATTTVTTSNNTTLTMPSNFTQHQNYIGITELAYNGDNGPPYDTGLLENNVDVVVPGAPSYFTAIHNADSSDQQLVYTNVSNIYSATYSATDSSTKSLTSWLNYAKTNGINPEQAFYHVSVATPYSNGSSASTHPVDKFSKVYDEATGQDVTGTAYNGGTISFGGSAGQTVDIGYVEPFWEINFDLTSGGSGGWSGVLEYPTAVDTSGNPTSWATLTTLNDTTNGLTQSGSGQITFNPPSNWVPASIDGTVPIYYVRVRTVTAGTAPVANTIKSDNYTDSPTGSNGMSGVIPAYDWALDSQGGYLDPQQYAIASAAGMTARFGYQSRLFYDGPMRFETNPSNPDFKAWALNYYPNVLSGQQYANGLFVDNSAANPPRKGGGLYNNYIDLVEPTDSYSNDYATLLNEIGLAIAPSNGWIMANTNNSTAVPGSNNDGETYADPVVNKVQAYYEEFGLSAVYDDTTDFLSLYNKIYYRVKNDNPNYAVIDSKSINVDKQETEQDSQTQLTTLAAYYLLAPSNSSKGALDFYGGEKPSSPWV